MAEKEATTRYHSDRSGYDSNPLTTLLSALSKLYNYNPRSLSIMIPVAGLVGIVINYLAQLALNNADLTSANNDSWTSIGWLLYPIFILAGFVGLVAAIVVLALSSTHEKGIGFKTIVRKSLDRFLSLTGLTLLLIFALAMPLMIYGAVDTLNDTLLKSTIQSTVLLLLLTTPYFLVRLTYSFIAVINGLEPLNGLKKSWKLSKGHFFETLGILSLSLAAIMVPITLLDLVPQFSSGITTDVSSLLSTVLFYVWLIVIITGLVERYRQLDRAEPEEEINHKSDPINYLAALALIVLIVLNLMVLNNQSIDSVPNPPITSQPIIPGNPGNPGYYYRPNNQTPAY